MSKSQTNFLVNLSPLVLLISVALLAQVSHGNEPNKTASGSSSPSDLAAGAVQATNSQNNQPFNATDDDANGDDGAMIKKDMNNIKDLEANKTFPVDNNQFYKPEYITDHERAMKFWVDFSSLPSNSNLSTKHDMLSKSHRRAAPIKLSFDFPFYGQPLRNIIIATGGFLYVGEHLHHWLAATQNISPLMANFDLSTSNSSDIHHYDNKTALVVQWQNVQMKDNKPPGNFSFQVTLHKNGDIVFVYKHLPVPISEIPEDEHPVKVGISDAFLIEKMAFFIRRKTIYDYHRLNLKDNQEILNQTAIYLKALPTCNQYDDCESCARAASNLDCNWCPSVKRCSNGFDRKRQEWITNSCEKLPKTDCSLIKQDSSPSSSFAQSSGAPFSAGSPVSDKQTFIPDKPVVPDQRAPSEGGTAFVTFLMFMALTSGMALWAFYAYKNPHTPSGQLLIKYRPTNWRWQNSDTRYTAASIHM